MIVEVWDWNEGENNKLIGVGKLPLRDFITRHAERVPLEYVTDYLKQKRIGGYVQIHMHIDTKEPSECARKWRRPSMSIDILDMFIVVLVVGEAEEDVMFWSFDCPLDALDVIKPDESFEVFPERSTPERSTLIKRVIPFDRPEVPPVPRWVIDEMPPCAERSALLLRRHLIGMMAGEEEPLLPDFKEVFSVFFNRWEAECLSNGFRDTVLPLITLKDLVGSTGEAAGGGGSTSQKAHLKRMIDQLDLILECIRPVDIRDFIRGLESTRDKAGLVMAHRQNNVRGVT